MVITFILRYFELSLKPFTEKGEAVPSPRSRYMYVWHSTTPASTSLILWSVELHVQSIIFKAMSYAVMTQSR
mgnify:FL=1